jgi:hypothetical protein
MERVSQDAVLDSAAGFALRTSEFVRSCGSSAADRRCEWRSLERVAGRSRAAVGLRVPFFFVDEPGQRGTPEESHLAGGRR